VLAQLSVGKLHAATIGWEKIASMKNKNVRLLIYKK